MRFFKKIGVAVLSMLLCATMLFQTATSVFSAQKTLYVKDIKLIYADSEAEAKEQLPKGYELVSSDINAETDRIGVYICYSTTENPKEAITDIKVMHESGGFERTDFRKSLDTAVDGVYSIAQEMLTAINEFSQNYKDGVPAAVYAKETLDYFLFDENTPLGEYMISGKGDYKDYGKMILMCHEDILNPILSLLSLGVQKKMGDNWIDKLANVDPTTYDSSLDAKYRTRATKLSPILQQFNDIYCYVLGYYDTTYTYEDLTDDNDKELFAQMAENKDMLLVIQSILQSYTVGIQDPELGEWTVEDLFAIGLNETLNMYESYALLECMTPGQEIMLRLTGPYNFIIGTQASKEILDEARKNILENIDTTEKISIWEGINLDIFEEEVGLTSAAQRSIAAGKQYDIFAVDVDTLSQKYRDVASIISSSFTIATCSVLVAKCTLVLAPRFFSWLTCYSLASTMSCLASSAVLSTILTAVGITFTIAAIVCAVIITFFIEDIIAWMMTEEYERTTIPTYMVDEVINKEGLSTYTYYKRVDNVKTDEELDLDVEENESGSDINVNEGYRWMALYTTDKQSVGNPIEAKFLVTGESGTSKEGYAPLSMFGQLDAVNLNSYADKTSSTYPAIYMHYVQDKLTPVESDKMYISHILVETGIHEDEVKKKLANSGYLTFNHDFGCAEGESTYIGYKLTANASDAVRDIRLFYKLSGTGVDFGDLSYGAMGTIGNFSVMVSRTNTNPAPPVVALKVFERNDIPDASLGYEPVNEFSGGMAQPLGRTNYRLYFLPETTFTKGPDYIAGIKTDVYYYNTHSEVDSWRGYNKYYYFPEDKYGNNTDNYRKFKTENYGEQFFDYKSETNYFLYARNNDDSHNTFSLGYKYNTTKNPYRAVYGIAATTRSSLDQFSSSVMYADEGFVLAATELSYNSRFYTSGDFVYAPVMNTDEFGKPWDLYHSYVSGYLTHYTDTNSPGKADATVINPSFQQWEGIHSRDDVLNQDITQDFYNDDMNALYLSGYQSDRTPLKVEDVIITKTPLEKSKIPENFTPVCYMVGDSTDPANVVPSNGEAKIGTRPTYYGFSSEDIMATLYGEQAYIYYRNEKTVGKKVVAQSNLKEGKYISAIFLSSREAIREESLKQNPQLLCKDINKGLVESSLLGKGATTTYNIHINTNFSESDDYENANYTYVGITRTDDPDDAIRDIKLYIAKPGEYAPATMDVPVTYKGQTFDVEYSLVKDRISITEQGNKSAVDCAEERQVYVYVSSNPALGDPITDIRMSDMFSYEDYEPVLTMENKHFLTAYQENENADGAEIFVDSDYFMYGNHLSFKREGASLPYIREIGVTSDSKEIKAIEKLLAQGYTDIIKKDLNDGAGGHYIYLGMKRTADKSDAIYELYLTNDQKTPSKKLYQYTLVSDLDLNYKAGGKYVYLYAAKSKPLTTTTSPLLDLYVADETFNNFNTNIDNNTTRRNMMVTNQDGEKQDLNQKAGGDYIYLVEVYDVTFNPQMAYLGSIIGDGSIIVVAIFVLAILGVGIFTFCKKKHNKKKKAAELKAAEEVTEAEAPAEIAEAEVITETEEAVPEEKNESQDNG